MADRGWEMRGTDQNQSAMFSYVSPEARVPADHPLRATRELANRALDRLDRDELQALVDDSQLSNPRRVTVGLEHNRLAMLLAVQHRHGGVFMSDQDVFVNVVGGVRVNETAADLPVLLAVLSSFRDRTLPNDLIVFGEVGLAGEIRPVPNGQERLHEAAKLGFKRALIPAANAPRSSIEGLEVTPVARYSEVLDWFA